MLGRYLQVARELARLDRAKIQQGVDIAAEKQHLKWINRRKRPRLALGRIWYKRYIVPNYGKPERVESSFIRYVDPIIKHLMVDQVLPEHIERILDPAVKAGAPIASDIAERALNHALQSTEEIYNQYDYLRERRMAPTNWANYLHALE